MKEWYKVETLWTDSDTKISAELLHDLGRSSSYIHHMLYIQLLFHLYLAALWVPKPVRALHRPILYPQIHEIHRDARSSNLISILILKETNLLARPISTDTSRSFCCDLPVRLYYSSFSGNKNQFKKVKIWYIYICFFCNFCSKSSGENLF